MKVLIWFYFDLIKTICQFFIKILIQPFFYQPADPPWLYRFRWSRPNLATFAFSGDSGGLTTQFHAYGRGGRIRTGDHLNPIQVRYLAALHPEVMLETIYCCCSLLSPLFLAHLLLTLVICNLVEPFNSSARLEAIQVNKTPCSIHWLLDLL